MLKTISIEPKTKPTAAMIWLHGLGANGADLAGLVSYLNIPNQFAVRHIFPDAPIRSVTLNGGIPMRAWFDIVELSLTANFNLVEIQQGVADIHALIDQQIESGISSEKIIIAGFSQGGALALIAALNYVKPLAGIIGLSTFLPHNGYEQFFHPANHATPILMIYGTADMIIPENLAEATYQNLKQHHENIKAYALPMGHEINQQEIMMIVEFIKMVL